MSEGPQMLAGVLAMQSTDDGILHVSKDSDEPRDVWSRLFEVLETLLPILPTGKRCDLNVREYTASAFVVAPGRAVFVATICGHPCRKSLRRWASRFVARKDRAGAAKAAE